MTDLDAYVQWCLENACMTTDDAMAQRRFEETGELPAGCDLVTEETPETVAGATLKVDEAKVAAALGGELPSAVRGLLEGGA